MTPRRQDVRPAVRGETAARLKSLTPLYKQRSSGGWSVLIVVIIVLAVAVVVMTGTLSGLAGAAG